MSRTGRRRNAGLAAALMAMALPAPAASAAPGGCVVLASMTKQFEELNKQLKDLNRFDVTESQLRENTREQVGLWRQASALLVQTASGITDSPQLAGAVRENGEAVGVYAQVVEELLPHSKDDLPPEELRGRFSAASARKAEAGRAMTETARQVCAQKL